MNTTIGCPIPGASQPKEPVRLIDIKEVLQYDGAHFTWSGGKNCLALIFVAAPGAMLIGALLIYLFALCCKQISCLWREQK